MKPGLGDRVRTKALLVAALAGIAALSFFLRSFDRNWDSGHHLHPDERHISLVAAELSWPSTVREYFDSEHSPLNPYEHVDSFVYGTLPLFLNKAVATLSGGDQGYDGNLSGRLLAALFDTGTVLLTFALARTLFGRRVGLLAALLLAVTVLHIQHGHFFVSEAFLVFFVVAALYGMVHIVRDRARWAYLLTGAAVGAAAAVKINALLLLSIAALAVALVALHAPETQSWKRRAARAALGFFAVTASALLVFRVLNPYAFSGPGFFDILPDHRFVEDLRREVEVQSGADIPPNFNWVGRAPLLYPIQNLVLWGLGIPIAAAAFFGVRRLLLERAWRKQPELLVLAAWVVLMAGMVARNFNVTMRYLLPIYPVLVVAAAYGLDGLWRRAPSPRAHRLLARSVAGTLLVAAALWALAFVTGVYGSEHPRVEASRWIAQHVPQGSVLLNEEWDDTLPLPVQEVKHDAYRQEIIHVYAPDSRPKILEIIDSLDRSDYIVQSSQRASASIPRVPARFPSTIRYYDALNNGRLGFERVAVFRTSPGLFGIELDDRRSDEAFTVYDHPPVTIWRKTSAYSRERAERLLQPDRADAAIAVPPARGAWNASQLRSSDYRAQQEGGTFTDVFDGDGWPGRAPWLWWLLWLELAAFAAVPWSTWLCRRLPDCGYGLSKVLGLSAAVLPLWLLITVAGVHFSAGAAWAGWGVAIAVGAIALALRRGQVLAVLRSTWQAWAVAEAVFVVVYLAFCIIRAANPDLWHLYRGGEKPMELAYFTAVTRSTALPPYDPWFAGGQLNYYYLGWFILAVPARALGIPPEIALNLGIPTFAALAASTAFSTGHNLVALSRNALRDGARRFGAIAGGLTAAALVLVVSNLDGARKLLEGLSRANRWEIAERLPVLGPPLRVAGGLFEVFVRGATLGPFDWWGSSRVYSKSLGITEFPLWSYIFGDVHPHVMAIPFFGTVLALALAYLVTARQGDRRRCMALAALLGAITAVIRGVHTWDFPTAILVAVASVVGAALLAKDVPVRSRLGGAARDAGILAIVHLAVAYPFAAGFEIFNDGLVFSRERTRPGDYLVHFGIFVVLAVLFLSVAFFEISRARSGALKTNSAWALALAAVGGVLVGALSSAGWGVVAASLVVSIALSALLFVEARTAEKPDLGKIVAMTFLLLGVVIAAGVDIVTVKDDVGRMNTVFKFLLEAWQLYALAGAYLIWYLTRSALGAEGRHRNRLRMAWAAIACLSLLAGLAFTLSGTRARLHDRFAITSPTLDGFAYLGSGPTMRDPSGVVINLADDEPIVRWLRSNARGTPTIVESVGPIYTWTSRISVMTGLPTVIGWDWHQTQQRLHYVDAIGRRVQDTTAFYRDADPDDALRFLARYDVTYVVVGTLERARGTAAALQKLAQMPVLNKVFSSDGGVVYEVDKSRLVVATSRRMNSHSS